MSWDHSKPEFLEEFQEILNEDGLERALEWAWSAYEYALKEGTESHAVIARAAFEMNKTSLAQHPQWSKELTQAVEAYNAIRCCSRDHDKDGNCDRHIAPGVARPLE